MDTVQLTIADGSVVTISADDHDRVIDHKWRLRGGYPFCKALNMSLHAFIIGQRPSHIPENYVIDHGNRNKFDASHPNLRWVTPAFNMWNRVFVTSSPYRGVQWRPRERKWAACFHRAFVSGHLGYFDTAREAFMAYATAVVREWPVWAASSDLLVGEGLLMQQEMEDIQADADTQKAARELPLGVSKHGNGFMARYQRRYLGTYSTPEAAKRARDVECDKCNEEKWQAHLRTPIPLNSEGHACIILSSKNGAGAVHLVPPVLYHRLTFGRTWIAKGEYAQNGWCGYKVSLHVMVYQLLNPGYVPGSGSSIDHINNVEKDSTEANLRPASQSLQLRNQKKRSGCSSAHKGIVRTKRNKKNPWEATFHYHGKHYYVGYFASEEAAVLALTTAKNEIIVD